MMMLGPRSFALTHGYLRFTGSFGAVSMTSIHSYQRNLHNTTIVITVPSSCSASPSSCRMEVTSAAIQISLPTATPAPLTGLLSFTRVALGPKTRALSKVTSTAKQTNRKGLEQHAAGRSSRNNSSRSSGGRGQGRGRGRGRSEAGSRSQRSAADWLSDQVVEEALQKERSTKTSSIGGGRRSPVASTEQKTSSGSETTATRKALSTRTARQVGRGRHSSAPQITVDDLNEEEREALLSEFGRNKSVGRGSTERLPPQHPRDDSRHTTMTATTATASSTSTFARSLSSPAPSTSTPSSASSVSPALLTPKEMEERDIRAAVRHVLSQHFMQTNMEKKRLRWEKEAKQADEKVAIERLEAELKRQEALYRRQQAKQAAAAGVGGSSSTAAVDEVAGDPTAVGPVSSPAVLIGAYANALSKEPPRRQQGFVAVDGDGKEDEQPTMTLAELQRLHHHIKMRRRQEEKERNAERLSGPSGTAVTGVLPFNMSSSGGSGSTTNATNAGSIPSWRQPNRLQPLATEMEVLAAQTAAEEALRQKKAVLSLEPDLSLYSVEKDVRISSESLLRAQQQEQERLHRSGASPSSCSPLEDGGILSNDLTAVDPVTATGTTTNLGRNASGGDGGKRSLSSAGVEEDEDFGLDSFIEDSAATSKAGAFGRYEDSDDL